MLSILEKISYLLQLTETKDSKRQEGAGRDKISHRKIHYQYIFVIKKQKDKNSISRRKNKLQLDVH